MKYTCLAFVVFVLVLSCSSGELHFQGDSDDGVIWSSPYPGGGGSGATNSDSAISGKKAPDNSPPDLQSLMSKFSPDLGQGYVLYTGKQLGKSEESRRSHALLTSFDSRPIHGYAWEEGLSLRDGSCDAEWTWEVDEERTGTGMLVTHENDVNLEMLSSRDIEVVRGSLCRVFDEELHIHTIHFDSDHRQVFLHQDNDAEPRVEYQRKSLQVMSGWQSLPQANLPGLVDPNIAKVRALVKLPSQNAQEVEKPEESGESELVERTYMLVFGFDPFGVFHSAALNVKENVWEYPESEQPKIHKGFAHVVLNGELYLVGRSALWTYDPVTKKWTERFETGWPELAEDRFSTLAASVAGDKIFVWMSEAEDSKSAKVEQYFGYYALSDDNTIAWWSIKRVPNFEKVMVRDVLWAETGPLFWFWTTPKLKRLQEAQYSYPKAVIYDIIGRSFTKVDTSRFASYKRDRTFFLEKVGRDVLLADRFGDQTEWYKLDRSKDKFLLSKTDFQIPKGHSLAQTSYGLVGFGGKPAVDGGSSNGSDKDSTSGEFDSDNLIDETPLTFYSASENVQNHPTQIPGSPAGSRRGVALRALEMPHASHYRLFAWGGCLDWIESSGGQSREVCLQWSNEGSQIFLDLF